MTFEQKTELAIVVFMTFGLVYIHIVYMHSIRKEGLRRLEVRKENERKNAELLEQLKKTKDIERNDGSNL